MKNLKEINHALIDLVEKRMELARLNYSDVGYDTLEEESHSIQDDFAIDYGDEFEKIFQALHTKHCPDTEVLSPVAYLAKKYIKTGKEPNGMPSYDIADERQGIPIDSKLYTEAYLVLLPNPLRVLLTSPQEQLRLEVWKAA